jgi:hypothetical protein
MTGTEVDALSASYAEGVRAGKRVAAKELREACIEGGLLFVDRSMQGPVSDKLVIYALRRWPGEEPKSSLLRERKGAKRG